MYASDIIEDVEAERIIEDLAPKKPEDEWDPLWCQAVRLLPDAKRLMEEADDLVKLGIGS